MRRHRVCPSANYTGKEHRREAARLSPPTLLRRHAWRRSKGFPENLRSGEDLDFYGSGRALGFRFVHEPAGGTCNGTFGPRSSPRSNGFLCTRATTLQSGTVAPVAGHHSDALCHRSSLLILIGGIGIVGRRWSFGYPSPFWLALLTARAANFHPTQPVLFPCVRFLRNIRQRVQPDCDACSSCTLDACRDHREHPVAFVGLVSLEPQVGQRWRPERWGLTGSPRAVSSPTTECLIRWARRTVIPYLSELGDSEGLSSRCSVSRKPKSVCSRWSGTQVVNELHAKS